VVPNPFRYIGAVWDGTTGLYKMGDRYYNPSLGQFTQEDPLGDGYSYGLDDPIDLSDPTGLDVCTADDPNVQGSDSCDGPSSNFGVSELVGELVGEPGVTSPGPHAKKSIPLRRVGKRATPKQQRVINRIGRKHGCHRCGTRNPGTKSGNFVLDHQQPTCLTGGRPQRGYPHCLACAKYQGGRLSRCRRR
jgi:RHS repeat-associated protein